jgi:CheY-like chemotaxis protein
VLEASTGIEALKIWKEQRTEIQLLLTDMMMSEGMTGKDLAQQLRKENPKLKVIYMSGYSADLLGKDYKLQVGVNFLAKPFQLPMLAQTVRNCLDKQTEGK